MDDLLSLFREQAYINGQWREADNKATFAVTNPANGQIIAHVSDLTGTETVQAIEAAQQALAVWQHYTAKQRADILRCWYQLIMEHQHTLAQLLSLEQGKPEKEALAEIAYGASYVEWFAEEGKRVYGDILSLSQVGKRLLTIKQPVGVVAAITPWNFPNAMITRKVAPALAAGCTVIIKPSPETPLSALALAALAEQAGIPAGVLNVVTGQNAEVIGKTLTASAIVRKLSFTGSTQVGRLLMAQSANTIKKLSLELGGNAPFIVFDDADLSVAVDNALQVKFRNSGQVCIAANRFLIHEAIYEPFTKALATAVSQLHVGPATDPLSQIGPLINQQAVDKVQRHIDDALAKGASVVTGGKQLAGLFFQPTVLRDVDNRMLITQEETFGPVAALMKFTDEQQGLQWANQTEYGLASYFFSRDIRRIFRVAEALESGMVGINEVLLSDVAAPFGGIKQSGLGREGSRYGLDEYLELKYLCMQT